MRNLHVEFVLVGEGETQDDIVVRFAFVAKCNVSNNVLPNSRNGQNSREIGNQIAEIVDFTNSSNLLCYVAIPLSGEGGGQRNIFASVLEISVGNST